MGAMLGQGRPVRWLLQSSPTLGTLTSPLSSQQTLGRVRNFQSSCVPPKAREHQRAGFMWLGQTDVGFQQLMLGGGALQRKRAQRHELWMFVHCWFIQSIKVLALDFLSNLLTATISSVFTRHHSRP